MVLVAAQICDEKKATDTRILELDPADSGFTDFFLITSGTNTRQTGAIADDIELRLKREFGVYARSVEGRRTGEWILLDYFDFVVHIFTEQTREYYDIERLRKSARPVDVAELSATLRQKTEAARKKAPARPAPAKKALPGHTGEEQPALSVKPIPVPARKTALKKAPAKKAAPKKAPAKKTALKKAPAKKAPAKKTALKKSPAKKAPAKKVPAKKAQAKKAQAKTKSTQPRVQDLSPRALPSGSPRQKQLPPSS
jgi:ribosome-associated protein